MFEVVIKHTKEQYDWVIKNIGPVSKKWHILTQKHDAGGPNIYYYSIGYVFENDTDAMAFKLRWT